MNPPINKTKTVKIGKKPFDILAHMTIAGMVKCWQADSKDLEDLIGFIADHPRLVWFIFGEYNDRIGRRYYVVEKPDNHRLHLTFGDSAG